MTELKHIHHSFKNKRKRYLPHRWTAERELQTFFPGLGIISIIRDTNNQLDTALFSNRPEEEANPPIDDNPRPVIQHENPKEEEKEGYEDYLKEKEKEKEKEKQLLNEHHSLNVYGDRDAARAPTETEIEKEELSLYPDRFPEDFADIGKEEDNVVQDGGEVDSGGGGGGAGDKPEDSGGGGADGDGIIDLDKVNPNDYGLYTDEQSFWDSFKKPKPTKS